MTKTLSNVRNLSIGRNFRCYETFRGRRYIVLLETFLKNAFLNTPSYLGCRWFSADRRKLSQCLIESNELSWRAKCTLRESQTQSHTYRARRGLRVECRLNEYSTWSQRMDCGLRGSREQNAISESRTRNLRAKGSHRERPREREKHGFREQNAVTESTVQYPASWVISLSKTLQLQCCIPQITDFFFFAFFRISPTKIQQ